MDLKLYEKLEKALLTLDEKYESIQKKLLSEDVAKDIKKMTSLQKEVSDLEDAYNLHQIVKKEISDYKEISELIKNGDKELAFELKSEQEILEESIPKNLSQLQTLLLPKDPNDKKNVIVEIRGGAGGDEGNIFAGDLYRMYGKYIEKLPKFKIELLNAKPAPAGGFAQIEFSIKGDGAYSLFKWESGAHRVQRVPATESKGRVHTSTATVLVMPEADEVDIEIKPSDLKIDTFKSSGAGGQHVNTTDSAVRITHIPTGTVVASQDGRSQHKNKEIAMTLLKSRVYDQVMQEQAKERGEETKTKIGTGNRSEKIRTYNYPQNRITDHRISFSLNKLDQAMEGNIEEVIDALLAEEKRLKIENS